MRTKYLCGLVCATATSCAYADLLPEKLEKPVERYVELREWLEPTTSPEVEGNAAHVFAPLDIDALGLPTLRPTEHPPDALADMDVTHYMKHYVSKHPKVQKLRDQVKRYERINLYRENVILDVSRSLRFLQRGRGRILTLYTNSAKPYKGVVSINLGSFWKRWRGRRRSDSYQPPMSASLPGSSEFASAVALN